MKQPKLAPNEIPKLDPDHTFFTLKTSHYDSEKLYANVLGNDYAVETVSLISQSFQLKAPDEHFDSSDPYGARSGRKTPKAKRIYIPRHLMDLKGATKGGMLCKVSKIMTQAQIMAHLLEPTKRLGITLNTEGDEGYRLFTDYGGFNLVRVTKDHNWVSEIRWEARVRERKTTPRVIRVDPIPVEIEEANDWQSKGAPQVLIWMLPLNRMYEGLEKRYTWLADPYAWRKRFGDEEQKTITIKIPEVKP